MGQEASTLNIPPRKVVKTLAVGQEVEGVVKRVTEFGAFIDIGVGRDGLVHVSELSQRRVAKASDVVQEGQTVTVWIKELDRDKNRISLSMVPPGTLTMRDLEEGMVVTGTVTRMERYGAFLDIGVGRDGMLHVKEMGHGYIEKPEDVIHLGEELQVQIVGLDQRRGRVDLSRKSLLPPPAESASPAMIRTIDSTQATDADPAPEEIVFVSPFELALQEANQGEERRRERKKKVRGWDEYEEEEDLIQRTIAHHRKSKGM